MTLGDYWPTTRAAFASGGALEQSPESTYAVVHLRRLSSANPCYRSYSDVTSSLTVSHVPPRDDVIDHSVPAYAELDV
jgi:hypothetical protein